MAFDIRNRISGRMRSGRPLIGNEQTAGIASELRDAGIRFFGGTPDARQNKDDLASKIALLDYKRSLADPELEALKREDMRSRIAERSKDDVLFNTPVVTNAQGQQEYATGEEFLTKISPEQQNLIRGITDYSLSPEKTFGLRNDLRSKYISMAKQYDPTFDASQFNTRQKYKQELASTKGSGVGRSVVSLNTAIPHLSSLGDAMEGLSSVGGFPFSKTWNKAANWLKRSSGDAAPADVDTALNAVAGELSTVFKGTSGTDQEIESWKSSFDPNGSSEQKAAFLKRGLELLEGRLGALEGQYEQTMGKPAPEGTFIYPKTRSIFEQLKSGRQPAFARKSVKQKSSAKEELDQINAELSALGV